MILRRLTQSLKEQNWTAIWIEFVLFVTGVFLGIQVSNWNADRETRKQSALFTSRLIGDLRVEAWAYEYLIDYNKDVLANARRALDGLSGEHPLSDEQLLVSAYRALPAQVQQALLEKCGDRIVAPLDYARIVHSLDYACTLDLPPGTLSAAVQAIRAQPALVPALRLRFADVETVLANLQSFNTSLLENLRRIGGRQ